MNYIVSIRFPVDTWNEKSYDAVVVSMRSWVLVGPDVELFRCPVVFLGVCWRFRALWRSLFRCPQVPERVAIIISVPSSSPDVRRSLFRISSAWDVWQSLFRCLCKMWRTLLISKLLVIKKLVCVIARLGWVKSCSLGHPRGQFWPLCLSVSTFFSGFHQETIFGPVWLSVSMFLLGHL